MKIKYTGAVTFVAVGVTFEKDLICEVPNKDGEYLLNTFAGKFELVQSKPKPKAKPKTASKVAPKPIPSTQDDK